ncbi:protein FAR1-RELATED SEQUENCE 6-like isoform X2 [Phalaenopsis equestris]|uniref:protein FAR1-RELATED SEQUENCE 6-like isoform X2 n=1 Tax=Phalaenopsis equestris TaxID=78828 RepID=UPI0009E248A9|nr:protein FAR1-RELATED SEQUENCE 6-like isoform X2 [Phalaenopsis equestris]
MENLRCSYHYRYHMLKKEMLPDSSKKDEIKEIITDDNKKPNVGMTFKTYDDVSNFYKQYALRVGFGVIVKKSWFSKSGKCRRVLMGCSRAGSGRADACYQARLTAKTNCQAMIGVRRRDDGLLHIVEANLEHNHPVSPSTAQSLRCYQKMACEINLIHSAGNRNSHLVEKGFGNPVEFGMLKLGEGDDAAIHQFFSRMQNRNPNFFYSVDLDQYGRLRNLFWADARARAASLYFCDVVSFDSTYLAVKYDLPLVSFIGTNHHGQTVLLGCGLLSKETVETYVWLFKTWLASIMGCQPNAFISNHCKAIQCAVTEVFPRIRHRLCLYNIMKKIPENLKGYAEFIAIRKTLKKLVYDCLRVDEFEERWNKMIKEFGLEGNEWLSALYENRHSWVPLYLKDTFWAGMSVSQRGESLSSYFDGFVNPKTTVKQFLTKYETIIQSKCKKEAQADSESLYKIPLIASKFYMEEQLSKLYTLNIFKKFQEELKATMYCHASPIKIERPICIFQVKECSYMENGKRTESKDHEVCYNSEELAVHCACGFFQFNGILCRHSLSVFKLQQVFEIPSQYVLDRWKKEFKKLYRLARYSEDIIPSTPGERYSYLSVRLLQLVELGFVSEERFQLALKLIRELEKSLLDDPEGRDKQPRLLSFETQTSQCVNDLLSSQFAMSKVCKNPTSLHTKRRGRPPKKTKESNVDLLVQTNKEQDFLRSSLIGSENLVFQAASTSSPLDVHLGSQRGNDLMEDVNSNELSFGTHFGVHDNPQHHLGGQVRLQSLYEQQALEIPARVQWLYPPSFQEEAHTVPRTR